MVMKKMMTSKALGVIGSLIVAAGLYIDTNFGIAFYGLVAALVARYVLYLIEHKAGDANPFVQFAIYMGGVGLTYLATPVLMGQAVTVVLVRGVIALAAVYELRELITQIGGFNFRIFHLSPAEQTALQTDVSDLKQAMTLLLDIVSAQTPAQTPTAPTAPTDTTTTN